MRNNIKYIVFVIISLFSCKSMNNGVDNIFELKYIQENYSRNDLLLIMGIGNNLNDDITCTWKISFEELDKQEYYTFYELVNNINLIKIINNSMFFINNYFGKMYTNKMYFHSVEYVTVNNNIFGDNMNISRNDWLIIVSYKNYENDFMEKVFVLPDYRIIISSNNYEEVR
ncbi:MAG: hypothetical protein LBB89_13430 [Treponema sp.]|jgi:hypothetical protein|nr:hypothetical protein [Treponema sp.]